MQRCIAPLLEEFAQRAEAADELMCTSTCTTVSQLFHLFSNSEIFFWPNIFFVLQHHVRVIQKRFANLANVSEKVLGFCNFDQAAATSLLQLYLIQFRKAGEQNFLKSLESVWMSPDFGRSVKSPFPQKRLWETISHFIKVPLCPGNEQCAWKLKYAEGENCKFETNNTLQSSETPCDFVFANKSIEHGQNFVYCPCKIHFFDIFHWYSLAI